MTICGIKLTHDGSIAVVDDNKLLFCVELEKIANNPRYTAIEDTGIIADILEQEGLKTDDMDAFVVDGWGGYDADALAIQPRLTIGDNHNFLQYRDEGRICQLAVAQYQERTLQSNVLEAWNFSGLSIRGKQYSYSSYLHVTGHLASAYCTSPFSKDQQDAYVLVWDGGMYPRLYFVEGHTGKTENLGPLFLLIGNIYTIFSQHFGPFKVRGQFAKDDLSVAGKVMAYVAMGQLRRELFAYFDDIYATCYDKPMGFANVFANEFKKRIIGQGYKDEDILLSFHTYLQELLMQKLEKKISRLGRKSENLCIAGGCALNIKWNSAIRNMGLFRQVYVPPFPNDSGSAIGMACAVILNGAGKNSLEWSVYSGPGAGDAGDNQAAPGWQAGSCTIPDLARLLYDTKEPVIVLHGRAELGPRALGNRSILADPTSPDMKDVLNLVKEREPYRPVSPICLEHKAAGIFEPGIPDPYMLFDHKVKKEWLEKIPAVCHLDETARLQTVNEHENATIFSLLTEYDKLCGIPLLCNTSANYKNSGFFPDVASASEWGRVNYVWCEGTLYTRLDRAPFTRQAASKEIVI
ncbi:MAG: nodulation protein NodU [Chitinophagaceae bacterium]|nr:nodulation protein NodU [Chitinophagaceae bacterium]